MKALDLKTYPPLDELPNRYGYRDFVKLLGEHSGKRKRLTDTELAAEYWSSVVDYEDSCKPSGEGMDHEAICGQVETLHRFATLPHYDQEEAIGGSIQWQVKD